MIGVGGSTCHATRRITRSGTNEGIANRDAQTTVVNDNRVKVKGVEHKRIGKSKIADAHQQFDQCVDISWGTAPHTP